MSDVTQPGEGDLPGGADAEPSSPGAGHAGDRVLGLVCLAIAIWYVVATQNLTITQFGSGPVGPKTLPTIVGILFAVFALILVIRPDESPHWPTMPIWWRLTVIVAVSFLFGQLLEPLGFILAATAMSIIIGVFFKGPLEKLVPLSFVFAVVLAFIFNNWLELRLPPGLWGGF